MLSKEHKFALGAKTDAHIKALQSLIPSKIETWRVIDIFMVADSRDDAMTKFNDLVAQYDPSAPKFE